jgi:hypothetical protein
MEEKYSIDEILSAVNEIQNISKKNNFENKENKTIKINNSDIPKNTLKLIEDAEKEE